MGSQIRPTGGGIVGVVDIGKLRGNADIGAAAIAAIIEFWDPKIARHGVGLALEAEAEGVGGIQSEGTCLHEGCRLPLTVFYYTTVTSKLLCSIGKNIRRNDKRSTDTNRCVADFHFFLIVLFRL